MKNRNYNNHAALEVKVDYVESKLDEAIRSFKESLKETIDKSEARLEADRLAAEKRLEADRQASETRLTEERRQSEARLAEERKESRASRRALNANFVAQITLIITVIGLIFAIFNNGISL